MAIPTVDSSGKIELASTGIFASLTVFLTWNLLSWIYMPEVFGQGPSSASLSPFAFMFKYFIWAAVLFYVAIISFFQWRLKLLGGLSFMLVLWLTISALYRYYSVLSLELTTIIGMGIEVISIALYVTALLTQRDASKKRGSEPFLM